MEKIKSFYRQSKVVEYYASATINIGLGVAEEKIFTRIFDKKKTILELGCGTGRIAMGLYELGYKKVLGIDYSREMIVRACISQEFLNMMYLFKWVMQPNLISVNMTMTARYLVSTDLCKSQVVIVDV